MPPLTWEDDRDSFCAQIAQTRSTLKILLKTKDEDELLSRWLKWHVAICGPENIFVLDNMSLSPIVEDTYAANPDVRVCRYDGFLDKVHDRALFPELYQSLCVGCDYYVFLDTDEFLTTVVDAEHHDPLRTLDFIRQHRDAALFPGIWLSNAPGSWTRFELGGNCGNILGGLLWGKPITKGDSTLFSNNVLHNAGATGLTAGQSVPNNLIVLHLNRLSAVRRIRSNLNKLIHHRALPPGASLGDALALPENCILPHHAQNIMMETRWLAANPHAWEPVNDDLTVGFADFRDDGKVVHPTNEQRSSFQDILNDEAAFSRAMARYYQRV